MENCVNERHIFLLVKWNYRFMMVNAPTIFNRLTCEGRDYVKRVSLLVNLCNQGEDDGVAAKVVFVETGE